MKVIGLMDGLPVFEIDRGKYVAVDVRKGKCYTMWNWYMQLGKWSDSFEKRSDIPNEEECLNLIEADKEDIVKNFGRYEKMAESEEGKQALEEQEDFYEWLTDDREYNWFDGYTDEEEDE